MIAEWLMKAMSNLVISHVLSLMLLAGFNYYIYLHARKTTLMGQYMILSSGPFMWILGKILKTVAPVIGLRWTFVMLQYFGMALLGPAFVIFCLTCLRKRKPDLPLLLGFYLPSVVLYLLILTNPLHHRFYTVFTFYRDSFGPVFYALKYWMYACTGLGFSILLISMFRFREKESALSFLFILAAAVPLIGSFYYPNLGNQYSGLRFDIVPLCFNITFIIFGIAVFRYDFLDIPPIARRQLLDALDEGIRISDNRGSVLYRNKAAVFLTDPQYRRDIKRVVFSLSGKRHRDPLSLETAVDVTEAHRRKTEIRRRTDAVKALTAEVEDKIQQEKEALFLQQRTLAARELHDLLGHSLTLFIARLEALRFVVDPDEWNRKFTEARGLLSGWKETLDQSLEPEHNEPAEVFLSRWLRPLVQSCGHDRQLAVELVVKGRERPMNLDQVRNIYAAVREGLTNSLRHGGADHVLVSLSFGEDCTVLIMDNGSGCDEIIEGNGLEGMQRRMEALGGTVRFTAGEGEGFISRLWIPLGDPGHSVPVFR